MARNDGVDRVTARNVNLADTKIAKHSRIITLFCSNQKFFHKTAFSKQKQLL